MDEFLRQKLAREMTHQQPVQSERPLADMWAGMNNLQRVGMLPIPFVSDAAGLLGDIQMYREQPEQRGLFNYAMSGMGLLPFVPGAFGRIVHHGSPHQWMPEPDFPRGRPRLDKIGTGEGAQAYGHGMYFAESPGVAKSYAEAGGARPKLRLGGKDVPYPSWDASLGPREQVMRFVADTVQDKGVDTAAALKMARDRLTAPNQFADEGRLKGLTSAIDEIEKQGLEVLPSGFVKSLDLPDEKLPGLLDWDAPLSEQPEAVRKALDKLGIKQESYYEGMPIGGGEWKLHIGEDGTYSMVPPGGGDPIKIWDDMAKRLGIRPNMRGSSIVEMLGGNQTAAEKLREAGIPGLRYFDAASRGAGDGTRNYVIWDQALLDEMARRMK